MLPELTAYRGKLLSRNLAQGVRVHAGAFLRKRQIVLDASLRGAEHTRILLHELFHFAWIRLSNLKRESYAELLRFELSRRARGEAGWSAELRKKGLTGSHGARFRDYACESFCDTAAWRYSRRFRSQEVTLAERWKLGRHAWFDRTYPDRVIPI